MIRKQLYITEGQDEALKDQAGMLGVSEAELTRRALSAFLSRESPKATRHPEALEMLLERTRSLSEEHRVSSGYRFNREELYTERLNRHSESTD